MVDESGNPRITDFGLASVARGSNSVTNTSDNQCSTLRWTAPEISMLGEAVSKASDVFSFGMVVIEVGSDQSSTAYRSPYSLKIFTGEVPFNEATSSEVVMCITRGERPRRPAHPKFTNPLWELIGRCWAQAAENRPKMEEVVEVLRRLSAFYLHLHGNPFTHIPSPKRQPN